MRWLAGLFGLAILIAPQAARAGDVTCVWRALPEDVRALSLRNYAEKGPDNLFEGVEAMTVGKALVTCVALPRNERAADRVAQTAGEALAHYVMQLGAETWLRKAYGIEPMALERAYGTIETRRRLEFGARFLARKDPSDSTMDAVVRAIIGAYPAADFKAMSEADFDQFLLYFAGRSVREQAERKF